MSARTWTPEELAACAAAVIERRGLAKNVLFNEETGGVCIRGALFECATGHPLSWDDGGQVRQVRREVERRVVAHVGARTLEAGGFPGPEDSVIVWNNAPGTTKEDVVAALRAVAGEEVTA